MGYALALAIREVVGHYQGNGFVTKHWSRDLCRKFSCHLEHDYNIIIIECLHSIVQFVDPDLNGIF